MQLLVEQQTELAKAKAELEKTNDEIHQNAEVIMPFQKKLNKNAIITTEACKALASAKKDIEACNRAHDAKFLADETENLQKAVSW